MRRVAPLLLAAGLVFAVAASAVAAPPSSDPNTAATDAAAWLARQVNDDGFIPSSFVPGAADLSSSVQAVTALAAAGVGRPQVDALLGYLGDHVDDFVVIGGSDHSGELAYLILAAVAGGDDPTVVRLAADGPRRASAGDATAEWPVRRVVARVRRRVSPGLLAARARRGRSDECRGRHVARRPAVRGRHLDAVPRRHDRAVPAHRSGQLHGSGHELDRARDPRPPGERRDRTRRRGRGRARSGAHDRRRLGIPRRTGTVHRRELDRPGARRVARRRRRPTMRKARRRCSRSRWVAPPTRPIGARSRSSPARTDRSCRTRSQPCRRSRRSRGSRCRSREASIADARAGSVRGTDLDDHDLDDDHDRDRAADDGAGGRRCDDRDDHRPRRRRPRRCRLPQWPATSSHARRRPVGCDRARRAA